MRRCPLLLLLLPLLAAAQSGSRVEGQLLNSVTQSGIGGIKVTVSSTRVQLTYETYTDAEGRFQIPLVAPGDYAINFDTRGYLPLPISDPSQRLFHVADMTDPVQFLEELTPLGVLSGRVFDGEGRPAGGVQMEMLRARGGGVSIAFADGEGRFQLPNLQPGAYVLLARPMLPGSGGDAQHKSNLPLPSAPEGERFTWAATYYPGATERSAAQNIVIHGGSNLTEYEIRLRAAPVWRVRGVVVDDQGRPAANADVTLHSSEPLTEPEASGKSAADGSFELPAVCPGDWRILAEVKHGTVLWRGFAPVSVARRDMEGVTVRIAPPFAVDGFVERGDPHSAFAVRQPVSVELAPVDDSPSHRVTADERSDGTLHLTNVYAGRYRIQPPGIIAGYYLDAVRVGITDVTGQVVDLAPGGPPIRLVYRTGAGRAEGLVENGWGSTVVMAPKDPGLLSVPFVRTAPTGMDGRFDIGSLRPGDYYLWAFDRADLNALMDSDFVRSLTGVAESVHVAQGEVEVTPNLKVMPWPE
ncbi:MAG TPA: carboxypeptidase-like regulatory domain-containing protein [Bryobacteraceae bacterium]|nr:carboxypeptidase-like regulatory domain-containing protein [Bryobacteraceae bacterium]